MANFRDILEHSIANYPDYVAFTLKNKQKEYRDITFAEFYDDIKAVGTAMINRGIAGERIAIVGANQYTWVVIYLATQLSGGTCVPLDKGLRQEELANSIARVNVKHIFYDKVMKKTVDAIVESGETSLESLYSLDDCCETTVDMLIAEGREYIATNGTALLDAVEIDDNAVSVLLFTSGTTSLAKIVMLSQNNLVRNTIDTSNAEEILCTDVDLSLLPYHHIFGSTAQWVCIYCGAKTVYCDGLKYIQKNLQEYKVTMFVGVPLIAEAMYKKVILTAKKEGKYNLLVTMMKVSDVLLKFGIDLRRKLFKSVHDALGGHLRFCILGGAAADNECMKGFTSWGIIGLQGYGLTETSPVLSAERPSKRRYGSIGIPNYNVEMDIFEPDEKGIGEIIARGECVTCGYYENEEATNEAIIDGWFHTGDLGYRDKDGFYFVTGRKKNMIVLKSGKKVFPEELEQLLTTLPYALETVVLGVPEPDDARDLVVTLKMCYNPEAFPGMTFDEIYAKVKEDVEAINETTPKYKRIQRIILTDQELIKTTTGKVKRFLEVEEVIKERAAQAK